MKLLRRILLLFIYLVILIACVSTKRIIEHGQTFYYVDCSGKYIRKSICYNEAKILCPAGYHVVGEYTGFNPLPEQPQLEYAMAHVSDYPGFIKGIKIQCSNLNSAVEIVARPS